MDNNSWASFGYNRFIRSRFFTTCCWFFPHFGFTFNNRGIQEHKGIMDITMPECTLLQLTPAMQNLASSATLSMNEAVKARKAAGRKTIHLGFGEASFPLHPLLKEALSRAATHTGYGPLQGIPTLRKAIANYLERTRQIAAAPEYVAVAPGSKPLLYALMQILDGDVLLPIPSWVSYAPQARLAGKQVFGVESDPADAHTLTRERLSNTLAQARQQGASPRILVVNTPSNPTGGMFSSQDAEAIAMWCKAEGITLICDEIYAELAHGWREHVSPARFYPEGSIVTGGLSKAFSAGGWRLGYASLPITDDGKRLMTALRAMASEIWSSATTPVQEAATVAYTYPPELERYVRRSATIHGYATNRLYEKLVDLRIDCPQPAGAFYLYPDFSPLRTKLQKRGITTSEELAHHLLEEWDIATLPGVAFGDRPDALRLRLATSMLYVPEDVESEEEKDVVLWELLEQADRLPGNGKDEGVGLKLPELERVRERFEGFVKSF